MDLSKTLDKVFLILPNYCLGQCISDFYQNYEFIQFCTSSVEAIFICKAFSESLHPHLASPHSITGGLYGVDAGTGQCHGASASAVAAGTILEQKLGSILGHT